MENLYLLFLAFEEVLAIFLGGCFLLFLFLLAKEKGYLSIF